MVAPGYGYGIVAMAALGYGGPQSWLGPDRLTTVIAYRPSYDSVTLICVNEE